MKIIIDRDKLISALTPALGFNISKNTVSYADGVLLECPGDPELPGTVRVTSYDLDKGMRTSVEAEVIEEGKSIINTQKLMQIVRALPSGKITVTVDDKYRAVIEGGSSRFEINAGRGEDFPMLPKLSGDKRYVLPQYRLRMIVNSVLFAVGNNDQRIAFNGAFLKIEGSKLTVVGCDGNRLAIAEMDAPDEDSPEAAVIVPAKILTELMKAVKDSEDDMTMMIARKHIIFEIGAFVYFARMIDSEYINYQRIIPDESKMHAFISLDAFREAIERASLVTDDKLGGKAVVKLDFSDNLLKISSVSTGGSIYEEIPAALDGGDLNIAFNCRFLLDALRACPSFVTTLKISMNGPLMGICIEDGSASDETKEIRFVDFLMPVRN